MINKIKIVNFKSIRDLVLPLSNLNVLTGANSVGKSSVFQTLLSLRQSYYRGNFSNPVQKPRIFLGDETSLIRLGTLKDIFNEHAEASSGIEIGVKYDADEMYQFIFKSANYDESEKGQPFIEGVISGKLAGQNPVFYERFQYLSADRLPPQESYPNPQANDGFLGVRGEFTPYFLEKSGNSKLILTDLIPDEFTVKSSSSVRNSKDTLIWQVNYWMQQISADVEVHVKSNTLTNQTELFYRYTFGNIPTGDRKPQNVGFGLSYTLPIIVALLSASKDSLLLIENPESHLHPYGQAKLAELLCRTAQAGVQIIVETHSDHIINGIAVACKKNQIHNEKVNIYYFEKDENGATEAIPVEVSEEGRIKKAPPGFFDQFGKDLRTLMNSSK